MTRASKRRKAEEQLRILEEDFTNFVAAVLRECTAGSWGLFGQSDAVVDHLPESVQEKVSSWVAAKILDSDEHIRQMRQQLGSTEPLAGGRARCAEW